MTGSEHAPEFATPAQAGELLQVVDELDISNAVSLGSSSSGKNTTRIWTFRPSEVPPAIEAQYPDLLDASHEVEQTTAISRTFDSNEKALCIDSLARVSFNRTEMVTRSHRSSVHVGYNIERGQGDDEPLLVRTITTDDYDVGSVSRGITPSRRRLALMTPEERLEHRRRLLERARETLARATVAGLLREMSRTSVFPWLEAQQVIEFAQNLKDQSSPKS